MKVGFIGLGRMGQVMARRLVDGGHEVGVYNRTAEKLKPLTDRGAKALSSIKDAANFGAAVFSQLYGIFADGTPRPMCIIICAGAVAALGANLLLLGRARHAQE